MLCYNTVLIRQLNTLCKKNKKVVVSGKHSLSSKLYVSSSWSASIIGDEWDVEADHAQNIINSKQNDISKYRGGFFMAEKNVQQVHSGRFFMAEKKVQQVQSHERMLPIKMEKVVVSSELSSPKQLEKKHVCTTELKEQASSDDSKLLSRKDGQEKEDGAPKEGFNLLAKKNESANATVEK